ncbi:cytochrome P450 [Streptomyces ipomoeae]|uniref:Unspecific monooxygenase n=2 Tax=Streptomyces ipomoeae TaxID=103232 RepID=L1KSB5_9ACTN|nr:cytochrome P450 [Streptomyces ipomoeae]EKX63691.1 unspecific monooxygenase [Streptomyces ipomoeae 91-03]MDX2695174.1 cytochrome P450 [Streptomyces ipomoeae]MDX2841145.1 cytochrome P450 [Streptomyces ipomoeae]TQE39299.1 cytochrome P450 [Streptomyces ipomoeae]
MTTHAKPEHGHANDFARGIRLEELWDDPYPIYRRLRAEAPVTWVPAVGRYLITRHEDIVFAEQHPELFSSREKDSLVLKVMGANMLREDDPEHRRLRAAAEPPARPRRVRTDWSPVFQRTADELIDSFVDKGEADLFADFAGPFAAANLAHLLGIPQVPAADMIRWSQDMMDGNSNYADIPEVWDRALAAAGAVEEAVDEAVRRLRDEPDGSVISSMLHAEDPPTLQQIKNNIKVIIGGGINEPRDVLTAGVWALLTHPEQRAAVEADPARWRHVFEETVRWISPIGMYPRQTTEDIELSGTRVPAGSRVALVIGSGNRDEDVFPGADRFDIDREQRGHLAFGGGPHFCMGTWVARHEVGEIAWPTLFRRLPGLELAPQEPVRAGGWVFRGLLNLPVRWQRKDH